MRDPGEIIHIQLIEMRQPSSFLSLMPTHSRL
jgi:hypothetical protein